MIITGTYKKDNAVSKPIVVYVIEESDTAILGVEMTLLDTEEKKTLASLKGDVDTINSRYGRSGLGAIRRYSSSKLHYKNTLED